MDVLRSISPSRTSVDATAGSIPPDRGPVTLGASFRTHSDGTLSTTDFTAPLERSTSIAPVKTHLDGLKHGEESPFHNPFNVLGREESSGIPSSSSSCSNGQLFPYDHSSTRSMFLSDPNTSPSAGEGMSDDREEGLISPPLSVPLAEDSALPTTLQTGISPLFASAVNISAQLQSHGHLSGTESVALQSRDQSVGSIRDQSRLPTPIPLPSSHAHSTSFISHGSFALHNPSPSHNLLAQQQQRLSISPQKIGHLTSTTLLADGLSALQNQQQQLTMKEHSRHSPKSIVSPSAIAIAAQDAPRSPRRLNASTDLPTLLTQPHISPKAISPVASARSAAIPLMPTAVVAPAIPAGMAASAFAFNFAANNTATRLLRPPGSLPLRYPLPIGFEEEGGLFVPGRKRKNWRRAQLDTVDGARRSLQPHYRYRVKLNHGLEQLRMMTCPTFNDATHYDILTCAIARIHELEEEIRLLEYHEDIARRRREKRLSLLATPKRRKTQFTFEGTTARDEEGNVIEGSVSTPDTEDASQPGEKKREEGQPQQPLQQGDGTSTSNAVKKEPAPSSPSSPSSQPNNRSTEGSDDRSQSIAQPKAVSSLTDSSPVPITTPEPTPLPSEAARVTAEEPPSPPVPASSASASTDTDKEGNRMCVSVSISPAPRNEAESQEEGTVSVPPSSSDSPRPLSAATSVTDQQASSSDPSALKAELTNAEPELPPSTSELHSLLFHSACLPRFILSTDFEFIAVNRAYAALFLAPIDLRGVSFLSIVQSELVQPASLTLASVLGSPDDVMQIEGLKIVDEGAVYSCELIIWCARETKEDGTRVATCIQGVELSRQPLIMARP